MQVDLMAEVLMPPGVRSLRQMLHATAVEVLLYLTQLHCQEMLDSLVDSLNTQYRKFMLRNPDFSVRRDLLLLLLLLLLSAHLSDLHEHLKIISASFEGVCG
jgi:hypothetical protein